ncbi:MAG: hypothetical protein OQK04_09160 [Kangiellaceae bacterium]|nr:hypothetical protein [Kangiellaceae bacterium]MCW8998869.1 hypothetical protein [Kangiellaceae bacterium]
MNNKAKNLLFASMASLVLSGCAVSIGANSKNGYQDLDSVFGGVTVGRNSEVRNVSSVNGGVEIKSGAKARAVDTVNGGIDIGNNVSVKSAETVNGGIDAGKNLNVETDIETVNGGVRLSEDSFIGRDVVTVNGDIDLNNVTIVRNVRTHNGDVSLANGSVVQGDLIIERSDSWFGSISDKPVIEIDDTSEVRGDIHLYKPVTLKISDNAKVGEVKKHYSMK